jgi:hypothetical protein
MRRKGLKRPTETERLRVRRPIFILSSLLLIFCAGCRTNHPLSADFSAPGWHVQQGQAVWKPSQNRPELTGELLLATNENGNFFLQFSKMPFPLATAQVSGDQWQIEFGANIFSRHGHGLPPNRFVWFQLPRALRDTNIGGNWKFTRVETNLWRLENLHTSETLEGEFFP